MKSSRGLSVLPTLLVLAILVAAGVGGYMYMHKTPATTAGPAPLPPAPTAPVITWAYLEASSTDPAMPMTKVSAVIDGNGYTVGTFAGSCTAIDSSGGIDGKGLQPNEIAATQCWFAGGGDEIGVFQENGKLVIKKGELGEGDAKHPPFRGNFTTVLEL
jgi:hypothetical protein